MMTIRRTLLGICGAGLLILPSAGRTPVAAQVASGDTTATGERVCRVLGRILDARSETPVAGASVWLETPSEAAFLVGRQSSTDGSYALEAPVCEPSVLRVNMIGYRDASRPVSFDGGPMLALTIRLELDPVEVAPLTVDVTQSLRLRDVGFYAREAWVESTGEDYGQFYDPEEIVGRSATGASPLGLAMNSRIRSIYGGCTPSYYIDGQWFRRARTAEAMLSYGLQAKDVEGIEIYRAVWGSMPEEYRDPNSNTCGAVVVWTRRAPPAEAPQLTVELCTPSDDPDGISFGGIVADEVTGVHLPASYVTLFVTRYGEEEELETIADDDGRYRYCDLGAWPTSVQARYGSFTAEPFEIDQEREMPGYFEVDLQLGVIRTGSVVGVVIGSSEELARTEVTLEGTDLTAIPDERGYFEIHGALPGDHEIVVRQGDEVIERQDVSIRSGATEAVTLDPEVPGD